MKNEIHDKDITNNTIKIKRALISVYDKDNIVSFAKKLIEYNVEIISTGQTHALLTKSGIKSIEISEYTGFDEIFDGRVKTLHPYIHGGILAVPHKHNDEMIKYNIGKIDLVVVNLYPFENTVKISSNNNEIIENIDIGGVALIRAAAKNFHNTCVITNKEAYKDIINNEIDLQFRLQKAREAFAIVARYDAAISNWFEHLSSPNKLPETLCIVAKKIQNFRYGENPHQSGALYQPHMIQDNKPPFSQLHGKELSYNNMLDIDAALNLLNEFTEPTAVIIKHNNPCGVSSSNENIIIAYQNAFAADPKSAFGGIIALNREVDENIANLLSNIFIEVVLAPSITKNAFELLSQKKNLRILIIKENAFNNKEEYDIHNTIGGIVLQTKDSINIKEDDLKVVSHKESDSREKKDLIFAMKVCKHVKSNAIVIAKNTTTLGIGAGQMSRIDSVKNAISKSSIQCNEAVLASDAFFPFSDSIDLAKEAGISAIIQPGGSIKDTDVIQAANNSNIAMYFTNIRHFKH